MKPWIVFLGIAVLVVVATACYVLERYCVYPFSFSVDGDWIQSHSDYPQHTSNDRTTRVQRIWTFSETSRWDGDVLGTLFKSSDDHDFRWKLSRNGKLTVARVLDGCPKCLAFKQWVADHGRPGVWSDQYGWDSVSYDVEIRNKNEFVLDHQRVFVRQ